MVRIQHIWGTRDVFLLPSSKSDHVGLLALCGEIHNSRAQLSIIQLSHCLAKISKWLWSNWLNLNPSKWMLETGRQAVFWWCCHICMHWQSLLPKVKLVYSLRAFLDSFDSWYTNLLQCQKSIFPSVIGKGALYLTLAILLIQLTHSVLESICES